METTNAATDTNVAELRQQLEASKREAAELGALDSSCFWSLQVSHAGFVLTPNIVTSCGLVQDDLSRGCERL
jgi:hypothetical protein